MKTIIHAIESFRKEHVSLLGLRPDPTFLVAMLLIFFASSLAFAGSGTWLSSPVSGDWNTPANWSSTTVPNGPADTATFGSSSISAVSISADTEVNGIVFTPHAQPTPFDITVTNSAFFNPPRTLTLSGAGITNNSGVIQNFFVARMPFGEGATIVFENQATAGEMTAFTGFGNSSAPPFWYSTPRRPQGVPRSTTTAASRNSMPCRTRRMLQSTTAPGGRYREAFSAGAWISTTTLARVVPRSITPLPRLIRGGFWHRSRHHSVSRQFDREQCHDHCGRR
jgi:hypothetical protein